MVKTTDQEMIAINKKVCYSSKRKRPAMPCRAIGGKHLGQLVGRRRESMGMSLYCGFWEKE